MGKRGKPAAPTALKLVRGTRSDRVNRSEPQPDAEEIVAPDWLSDDAREVWDRVAPDLEAKGVLTAWDVETFAAWCDAVVRLRHAVEALDLEGEVVETPVFDRNGAQTGSRWAKNPWMFVWKDANEVVARVGARFGLTASDRSQLQVGDGQPSNPGERLLS